MPPLVIDIRQAEDSRDVVHRAVQELVEGKLVAFPTETVYGLAASALNEKAVARLIEIKGRDENKPLTLAIKCAEEAFDYVPDMVPLGQRLARRCWPGPITLVVNATNRDSLLTRLPPSVQQAVMPRGTLGLRVPAHPTILDVLKMIAGPVVLTSANQAGQPDAVNASEVASSLNDEIALLLDDGPSRYGQPSAVVRVDGQGLEVLRQGVVPESTLKRLSSFMILLVCTGNTCRSPMAEVLARKLLAERLGCDMTALDDQGVIVLSAGLAAMAGGPPTPEAVRVMQDLGLILSDHESQPLTEQLARHADVILTMTAAHRHAIVTHWPHAASRTHQLCRDNGDVSDPIGGSIEVYRQCAEQIKSELQARISDLDII